MSTKTREAARRGKAKEGFWHRGQSTSAGTISSSLWLRQEGQTLLPEEDAQALEDTAASPPRGGSSSPRFWGTSESRSRCRPPSPRSSLSSPPGWPEIPVPTICAGRARAGS